MFQFAVFYFSEMCLYRVCCIFTALLLKIYFSHGEQLQFLGEQPFRAYASRSTTVGQVLYQVFAVNASSGDSTGITYSIDQSLTERSSSRHFFLRTETGELELHLLFSSLADHTLVVEARSSSQATARVNLVVVVVPELNLSPRYEQRNYDLSVCENHVVNQAFSILRAFALSPSSFHAYSIVSSTGAGSFAINSSNGLLSTTRSLDRERVERYFLRIRYSFSGGFVDADVTVTVLDANDNPPRFAEILYNVSIPENLQVSSCIVNISAADADAGSNGMIQYTMLLDSADPNFSLDSETGALILLSPLDFERENRYVLSVGAADAGTPSSTATVMIIVNIINVDDECPVFENPLYVVDIPFSQMHLNQLLLTVVARDPDGLSSITYDVVSRSETSSVLSLNRMTGGITLTDNIILTGRYSLNITANDGTCSMESFSSVQIRIMTRMTTVRRFLLRVTLR